jgi:hypothetical protein
VSRANPVNRVKAAAATASPVKVALAAMDVQRTIVGERSPLVALNRMPAIRRWPAIVRKDVGAVMVEGAAVAEGSAPQAKRAHRGKTACPAEVPILSRVHWMPLRRPLQALNRLHSRRTARRALDCRRGPISPTRSIRALTQRLPRPIRKMRLNPARLQSAVGAVVAAADAVIAPKASAQRPRQSLPPPVRTR